MKSAARLASVTATKFTLIRKQMKIRSLRFCLIAALSCAAATAMAENPFAGTWKVDYSKSQVTGQTISFTSEAGDKIRFTNPAGSYTFKPDGSDATTSFGDTAQWTKIDDHTWKAVVRKGSTPLSTDTWKLNDDGKTLEVSATGTRPSGQKIDDKETFARIAPGNGILGKWKSTKYEDNSPTTSQIDANGDNGIVWHIPEIKAVVNLTFDGKEATPTGPTVPDGLTLSATKIGPRSFEVTEKVKGKVIYHSRYTVSADGNTMTEEGGAPGATPVRVVMRKS
jgi:hypothetical protein